ncbi:von Willebrand factor type A domain protein [Rubripirellula obstinata]|uniref:von Willebrand factor type A domain protein n=1 Tax=Rubripirellula obstinata TaxID=406547 RepID=A0A5B1CBQ2_9BACT|nr:VWA domain-containing protein [Rubripirellula obstinata]KAA1257642.1 von Willebrand factor type A domain protein [Rubripirellula obstinata]
MIASLRFSGDMPAWLVIVAAIVSAFAVLLYYLRETRSLDSSASFLIPSLRAAAVALVIFILAGPIWHSQVTVGRLGRVVFAVDQSASMSAPDTSPTGSGETSQTDSAVSRVDRANRLLEGNRDNEGWVERLANTHQVEVSPFSAGSRTDIGSALAAVSNSLTAADSGEDASHTAVVVFSDGRNNAGPSPLDESAALRMAGVTVHTIGIGNLDEPPGVGISAVEHPDSVAPDGTLKGKVQLLHSMEGNRQATVLIETDDQQTLWEKEITLASGNRQSVAFEIDVETALQKIAGDAVSGIDRGTKVMNLRAVVRSDGEDWIRENNRFDFRVSAATRKRRLLILDGGSRWEMRYLKNLFQRDPGWMVNTVLFGIGTDNPRMLHGDGDGDDDGKFPDDQESMGKYDAVVLGEIPAEFFDERDSQLLSDFVNRGGGLIVIDGQYGQVGELIKTRLPELIPVRHDEVVSAPPESIQLTTLGSQQPAIDLFGDAGQLESFWRKLPSPTMTNSVSPAATAEVWAETVDVGGGRSPWLVTHLFGGGRVFYFASDQTWRWRYKVGDRFHARFWNQIMEAAMQPPYSASDEYLAVGTDRLEYESGGSPIIRARLQNIDGGPVGDSTVDALLVSDNEVVATVPLVIDDPQRGTYRGQASGLPDGSYEVRIRASGFDQAALRATTPIWVGGNDAAEWNRISVNDQGLSAVAKAGGGEYRHESSADEIFTRLEMLSTGRVVESDVSLWESFYWFWAVMGLLTAEWVLRKRSGLV